MKKLQSAMVLCLVGWAFTTQTTVIQAVESQSVGSITKEIEDLYKKEAEVYKTLRSEEYEVVDLLERIAKKLKGDE